MSPKDEAALATFMAKPEWPRIRPLLAEVLGVDLGPLDQLIRKVRIEHWGDRS